MDKPLAPLRPRSRNTSNISACTDQEFDHGRAQHCSQQLDQLSNTGILARTYKCMDWLIQEARQIIRHSNNMNQDGFFLHRLLQAVTHSLKERQQQTFSCSHEAQNNGQSTKCYSLPVQLNSRQSTSRRFSHLPLMKPKEILIQDNHNPSSHLPQLWLANLPQTGLHNWQNLFLHITAAST